MTIGCIQVEMTGQDVTKCTARATVDASPDRCHTCCGPRLAPSRRAGATRALDTKLSG